MAAVEAPSVVWVPGPKLVSTYAVLVLILAVVFANGFLVFPYLWNLVAWGPALSRLVGVGEFAAALIGLSFALAYGLPRGASLGFCSDGLLIETGDGANRIRLAYRWDDVSLRGRILHLRPRAWDRPWYFVLSPAQARWAARGTSGGDPDVLSPAAHLRERVAR